MTRKQIERELERLKKRDPEEYRRVAMGAVIQIQVKLRNDGVEFETELGGEMYRQ